MCMYLRFTGADGSFYVIILGLYTCIAENESGRTTIAATVTVERMLGVPRISIEPFNLEAFTGTTIELPCKAAEPSGIKVSSRQC